MRLISCGRRRRHARLREPTTADAFDARVKRTYGSTEAPTVTTVPRRRPQALRPAHRRAPGRRHRDAARPGQRRAAGAGSELFAGYVPARRRPAAACSPGAGGSAPATGPRSRPTRRASGSPSPAASRTSSSGAARTSRSAEVEAHCEAHPAVPPGRRRRLPRRAAGRAGRRRRGARPGRAVRPSASAGLVRAAGRDPVQDARAGRRARGIADAAGRQARPAAPARLVADYCRPGARRRAPAALDDVSASPT